jgi:hypothetical protein
MASKSLGADDSSTPEREELQDQGDYSDYGGDSLENSYGEMSDDLIYQSTEMHPEDMLPSVPCASSTTPPTQPDIVHAPLSLSKIIEKQMDSDEEQEIRLLLAISLHDGASEEEADCDDEGSHSPDLEVSVDEVAVDEMQRAIDAALAETYATREPSESVKFETPAEIGSPDVTIAITVDGPAGRLEPDSAHAAPVAGYYSDMDSSGSDRELEADLPVPLFSGTGGETAPPPLQFPTNANVSAIHASSSTSHSLTPTTPNATHASRLTEVRPHIESEYSDMSSNDSADDTEYMNGYVYEHNTPQLRSLELQPLARRIDETLVGGRNQDYLGLAYMYKLQRPYADHSLHPMCVLCHKFPSDHVFFPCEHRCVCQACMKTEKFCEEGYATAESYSMCPLCAGGIKRILPHEGGAEVAKYWAWVEEISPALPPGFLRSFGHSAKVLQNVYIGGGDLSAPEADSVCKSS